MGFFDDTLNFEKFHGKELLGDIWKHPRRLITGVDPFSTNMWNGVLGTDDKPLVDQMGGAMDYRYDDAKAEGINPKSGRKMQDVAHLVTALFAGNYGADKLGMFGGAEGGSAGNTLNYNPGGWNESVFGGGDGGLGSFGSAPGGMNWMQLGGRMMNGFGQGMQQSESPSMVGNSPLDNPGPVMAPEAKQELYQVAPNMNPYVQGLLNLGSY